MATLIDHPVKTAADLAAFIDRLKSGGFDLDKIAVTNGADEPVGSVELEQNTADPTKLSVSFWLQG